MPNLIGTNRNQLPTNAMLGAAAYMTVDVNQLIEEVIEETPTADALLDTVQDSLIAANNIKTINGQSPLGAGNIEVPIPPANLPLLKDAAQPGDIGFFYVKPDNTWLDMGTVYLAESYPALAATIGIPRNNGSSWALAYSGGALAYIVAVTAIDTTTLVAVGYSHTTASSNRGIVYRSTNAGVSWTLVYSSSAVYTSFRSVIAVSPTILVVAGNTYTSTSNFYSVIYRSTDAGLSWSLVYTSGVLGGFNGVAKLSNTVLIAVGADGAAPTTVKPAIYRSTDGGLTWANVYTRSGGTEAYGTLYDVIALSETELVAVGSSTSSNFAIVYRSDDSGATWYIAYTSEAYGLLVGVTKISDTVLVATGTNASNFGVVYRSEDAGLSWSLVFTTSIAVYLRTLVLADDSPTVIVAVGYVVSTGYLTAYRSVDGGATWTLAFTHNTVSRIQDAIAISETEIVAVGYNTSNYAICYRSIGVFDSATQFTTPADFRAPPLTSTGLKPYIKS